ncbi:glycosyl transferase family 39 [Gloeothece citriformis PCC 7424]|uniref:Polyprenol-phosphate-mannose--protein mannosyltransferase n=2 Tax=Gloeothece TaxID=28070 RepID=B7KJT3_GLOC7|nr:glycosyl transferase family 39 [Gloeothece citriformis PCC 7424]
MANFYSSFISSFRRVSGFQWGMTGIFIFSLLLRFWKLGQFNTLVFDEVYYAKFANNYLTGTHFFQSHPPLSQYLIAFGIWLGSHFPASPDTINTLTGSARSTWSYRWLNAFSGSFLPLIVGAIAYQLTSRRSYGLIAALLVALDGLFLVESRYALNNIYLVSFGLLGQLFFLLALESKNHQFRLLIFSGIFFGCCVSIKWNGLGFILGTYLILALYQLKNFSQIPHLSVFLNKLTQPAKILNHCQSLKFKNILISLVLIPIVTYTLLWIPHLIMNPQYNFWEVHREIYLFHRKIGGNSPEVHRYCSPWYTWLIMWRPVAYFYEKNEVIYDVHAMGNPLLWWMSSVAIFILLILFLTKLFQSKQDDWYPSEISLYLLFNYTANLLPWIKVSRCTFLYHYMAAYLFAILALAWMINQWLRSQMLLEKITGIVMIVVIIVAFIHWLPIYLGLPLSDLDFKLRLLFRNWI